LRAPTHITLYKGDSSDPTAQLQVLRDALAIAKAELHQLSCTMSARRAGGEPPAA